MPHAFLSSPFARLRAPCLMGIVNITPDSFSDGGRSLAPAAAEAHARLLVQQGAQIIDLGAEASSFFRPGVKPIPAAEQIRRLIPVLQRLSDLPDGILLSVDTRSAEVARAAIHAGAHIINDISAGEHDPDLLPALAAHNAAVILMHMHPHYPQTPRHDDPDILHTVQQALAARHAAALLGGIPERRIALDPGIGFGKTMADNWRLSLRARDIALPGSRSSLVLGASRKRFLETQPPPDVDIRGWSRLIDHLRRPSDHPRDAATAALTALSAGQGVPIHRVHNVALAQEALARNAQTPDA